MYKLDRRVTSIQGNTRFSSLCEHFFLLLQIDKRFFVVPGDDAPSSDAF